MIKAAPEGLHSPDLNIVSIGDEGPVVAGGEEEGILRRKCPSLL